MTRKDEEGRMGAVACGRHLREVLTYPSSSH